MDPLQRDGTRAEAAFLGTRVRIRSGQFEGRQGELAMLRGWRVRAVRESGAHRVFYVDGDCGHTGVTGSGATGVQTQSDSRAFSSLAPACLIPVYSGFLAAQPCPSCVCSCFSFFVPLRCLFPPSPLVSIFYPYFSDPLTYPFLHGVFLDSLNRK